eukprot:jgi/Botrbrau1/22665/Bobra.0132s0011.1
MAETNIESRVNNALLLNNLGQFRVDTSRIPFSKTALENHCRFSYFCNKDQMELDVSELPSMLFLTYHRDCNPGVTSEGSAAMVMSFA